MTSEKQIAANRQNALKAGVKTAEGKLAIRLNAVSHGLFTQDVLLPGENDELLNQLADNIHAELKPVGEIETILVERVISSTWRLKRALFSEHNYIRPAATDFNNVKEFFSKVDYRYEGWQKYLRYETALERQIYKALNALERLQRIRQGEKLPLPVSLEVNLSHDNQS